MTGLLGAIQFDNDIRGILVVIVGTVVLMGSIYLIISTNVGMRLGFLITMAALFGWMFLLGIMWWMYGIGLIGRAPAWAATEINFNRTAELETQVARSLPPSDELPDASEIIEDYPLLEAMAKAQEGEEWEPDTLTDLVTIANPLVVLGAGSVTPDLRESIETNAADVLASNPEVADLVENAPDATFAREVRDQASEMRERIESDLGGWCLLAESDPRRGEAVAASDAALAEEGAFGDQTGPTDYIVKDVFIKGGKEPCAPITEQSTLQQAWHRIATTFELKNPKLYSVVTLVKAQEQVVAPGAAPGPAQVEPGASTVSTIMLRNLGNKRLVPFAFTLVCFILFAVFVAQLHHRDKLVRKHLEDAAKG
jgi:hypothetical protein